MTNGQHQPTETTSVPDRVAAATDEQIRAVQRRLRACAKAASQAAPLGAPSVFLQAINELRTRPDLLLDVAPELRQIVEQALTDAGA